MTDNNELLSLVKQNNQMLRYICEYINIYKSNADNENTEDFIRNIIANLIGDKLIVNK